MPVLPRRLAVAPQDAASFAKFTAERAAWFRLHGIEPGNWARVRPILHKSWAAYGIESSAESARRRLRLRADD